jgi:PAS domain S-box-containing protein
LNNDGHATLGGDTAMARMIRATDWSATPLGPIETWPEALRTSLSTCLASPLVGAVIWGPEHRLLYNDGYAKLLADRHPGALGQPMLQVWTEIADVLAPQLAGVSEAGRGFVVEGQRLDLARDGASEETYWLYSFAPILGEAGEVVGLVNTAVEATGSVLAERARREGERRLSTAGADAGLTADFRALFETAPTPFVVLSPPDWTIVAANDARLEVTGTTREQQIGRRLFDLFPDDPDDPEANGVRNLSASLNRVVATGRADVMPVQRYAVRDAEGRFVERWWSPINTPVPGSDGSVALVIHRVEEVTELVRLRGEAEASDQLARDQQAVIDRLRSTDSALRGSEERNRRIVEGVKDYAVFVADLEGTVTDWTPGAQVIFGWPAEEIVGQSCALLFTPEDQAAGVPAHELTTARDKGCANDERWHLRYDGSRFFANGSVRPLHDDAGQVAGFIKIARDETERRATEARLRASEEFNSRILASSADCIKVLDLDGRLEFMSEGGMCVMEVEDFQAIEGACWPDFWQGEEHARALEAIAEAKRGGTGRFQGFATTMKGSPRWWDVIVTAMTGPEGRPDKLLSISRDVTGTKAAEVQLRELNETLEAQVAERTADRDRMWRLSTDLMLVARLDATITATNPAWSRLLGWSDAELAGHSFIELVHPDDQETTIAEVGRLSQGATTFRFENRYRASDGSYRWISWIAVPDESLIHAVGRDVTAERQAAEELAKAQDALRQAQKMEAVGQLTGGLAHDFNNLLTGIMGNLELLQLRVARGRFDDVDRLINAAQGAGRRAASLTQRLLAFSRRQTLDPKPTDVNRLIAGMEELLRRTVGASADIEIVGAGGLWPAMIDAGQLENALLNLCINARDAMPDGGRITIETANKWLDDRAAKARDLPPGQYLSICVTDTGTGMTPEVIDRAFEPFYTTKPLGQGTGLGLSMIYGFARQSGGQVRIYSEVGQGTTMCIYLPRYMGDADTDEASGTVDGQAGGSGETVLVVDDEATIRHLVDEVLDELGYTVIGAADGAGGLKVLQSGSRIDLLVTDVGLPNGMNGRQLADAARAFRPDLKVLFITGYAENAAVGNGLLEPGMELLTKPFTLDDLTRKVRDMLE